MRSIETFGIVGFGEFGGVAAKHLAPTDAEVIVFDQNSNVDLPDGVSRADFGAVAAADVVVLAVPFDAYSTVLPALAAKASKGTLLFDVCSVKVKPTQAFKAEGLFDRDNILMTHPLFGPQSTNGGIAGKTIVVTESHGERADDLLGFWQKQGANITRMSPDEHDREMAKVHVLPFLIGRSLLNMDVTESPLGTNHFSKLLALADLERHHSAELFATIQQHNPFAASIRSELIAEMSVLHAQVRTDAVLSGDSSDLLEQLRECRDVLDLLDEYSLDILGLRFAVTKRIGRIKPALGLASVDSAREQEQEERIREIAADHEVPFVVARKIHRTILEEVVRQHEEQRSQLLELPE